MIKKIEIGGREVTLRATAAIPRLYRIHFRRDVIRDMQEAQKAMEGLEPGQVPEILLTTVENLAYLMARHADPQQVKEESVEDWLASFDGFVGYDFCADVIGLWSENMRTLSDAKKKDAP